jgi:plasmid replication initiation protein
MAKVDVTKYDHRTVEKHVAAVHISGDLTSTERKLMNVLLLNALDQLPDDDVKIFRMPVEMLISMTGYSNGTTNNYAYLKKMLKRLMRTVIEFDVLYDETKEEKLAQKNKTKRREKWQAWTLLASAEIADGWVEYEYSQKMKARILERGIYAQINIGIARAFHGAYALALYENCVRFIGTGMTGNYTLPVWQRLLGVGIDREGNQVPSAYDKFKHFNGQVLKPAITEVNESSDIFITPIWSKEGREVKAIQFKVEPNPQRQIAETPRDDEAARKTETYALLQALGVADTSACAWIAVAPDYALHIARELKKRKPDAPTPYGEKMFNTRPANFVLPEKVVAATLSNEAAQERETDERAARSRALRTKLLQERGPELAAAFIAQTGATSYSAEKGRFTNAKEIGLFNDFITTEIRQEQ